MNPNKKYQIRYFHLKNALTFKNPVKILDVGCGTGELTNEISKHYKKANLTACDINSYKLKRFNATIGSKNIKLVKCYAEKLPFKNGTFDLVYMFDVLEHLKDPNLAIAEIRRVLTPGGKFHLVVPCEGDINTLDGLLKKLFAVNIKEKPIGHIQQFSYREIVKILHANGFRINKINYSYYFLYQFLSLVYYAAIGFFAKGDYVPLLPTKKSFAAGLVKSFVILGGWVVYCETLILKDIGLKGQTMHITSLRI